MNLRVIDLELITKHYVTYQDGISDIRKVRDEFKEKVEPIRKEMQKIITQSTTGLLLDNLTQQEKAEKFQTLQQELVAIDADYKHQMNQLHGDLKVKTYDELEVIVSNWANENKIDLVTGKMEVIFSNPKYESTNEILEVLKTKGVYVESIDDKLVD